MRLNDVTSLQRKLLAAISGQISGRLEAHFVQLPSAGEDRIGVALSEGNRKVVVEIASTLLIEATTDTVAREQLRIRLKGRRDRLMFRAPPPRPAKNVAPLTAMAPRGFGPGRR